MGSNPGAPARGCGQGAEVGAGDGGEEQGWIPRAWTFQLPSWTRNQVHADQIMLKGSKVAKWSHQLSSFFLIVLFILRFFPSFCNSGQMYEGSQVSERI